MGGSGSGRPQLYDTTEGRCAIDLAFIRRQRRIGGNLAWSIGGLRYASVEWVLGSERLLLKTGGEDWQRIPLAWTPLPFGGEREWLICPCGRRCRIVYLGREGYRCRTCYRLTYASQRQPQWQRSLEIANRLRERLGGDSGFDEALPRRPSGMHRSTYHRLEDAYWRRMDRGMAGLVRSFRAIQG